MSAFSVGIPPFKATLPLFALYFIDDTFSSYVGYFDLLGKMTYIK
jgi:hypothetical protein